MASEPLLASTRLAIVCAIKIESLILNRDGRFQPLLNAMDMRQLLSPQKVVQLGVESGCRVPPAAGILSGYHGRYAEVVRFNSQRQCPGQRQDVYLCWLLSPQFLPGLLVRLRLSGSLAHDGGGDTRTRFTNSTRSHHLFVGAGIFISGATVGRSTTKRRSSRIWFILRHSHDRFVGSIDPPSSVPSVEFNGSRPDIFAQLSPVKKGGRTRAHNRSSTFIRYRPYSCPGVIST